MNLKKYREQTLALLRSTVSVKEIKTFYKTDTWMRRETRKMAITDFIFSTTISKNICLNTFTKWTFSYSLSTNTRMRLEYLEHFSVRQLQFLLLPNAKPASAELIKLFYS
jgi:hypothetical protein